MDLVNLFNNKYKYNGKLYVLKDIINLYVKNTLSVMNEESQYKEFIFYEG
jgi:hypothetical protein